MQNNQQALNKQVTYLPIVLTSTQNKLTRLLGECLAMSALTSLPFEQLNHVDQNICFPGRFEEGKEEIQQQFWEEEAQDQELIISIPKNDALNHSFN